MAGIDTADRELKAALDEERVLTECPCMVVDGELCDVCRGQDAGYLD
jgi:hypothetical protein